MPIQVPKIGLLEEHNETRAPIANLPNSAQLGGGAVLLPIQVTSASEQ